MRHYRPKGENYKLNACNVTDSRKNKFGNTPIDFPYEWFGESALPFGEFLREEPTNLHTNLMRAPFYLLFP